VSSAVAAPAPPPELIEQHRASVAAREQAAYHARIERYGTDPLMRWSLTYFQHLMVHQDGPQRGRFVPPGPPQQELTAALSAIMETEFPFPRLCGEFHRDGAKSTYGTTALVLWAITKKQKRNVLILCSTKDEAKDRIRNIVEELETNDRLRADHPELSAARDIKGQTKSYTDYQIILSNGARIKAYEFGRGKLRGTNWQSNRPDLVILDDPEHEDLEYSETYRTRARHWLQAVVLRAITRWCPVIWLGTPIGQNALILWARRPTGEGEDPGLGWRGPFVPIAAELDEHGSERDWTETPPAMPFTPTPATDLEHLAAERGLEAARAIEEREAAEAARWWRPAWPERFSPLDVARMLSEGDPQVAQQELMLRPVSREKSPFDIAWFDEHTFDPGKLRRVDRGIFTYDNVRLSRPRAHIDSAESISPTADFTAITVGAQHPETGKVLLLKLYYARWEIPEQLDILNELHQYYGCQVITGQASQLETAIEQFNKRFGSLPLELLAISQAVGAKDRRIRNLTVPVKAANVLFNPADADQRNLRTEMKLYPGGKDDALDSLQQLLEGFLERPGAGGPEDYHVVKTTAAEDPAVRSF